MAQEGSDKKLRTKRRFSGSLCRTKKLNGYKEYNRLFTLLMDFHQLIWDES
ncbi:MAG: hypothetical protein V7641_3836 [Blastocatellia bacterium]